MKNALREIFDDLDAKVVLQDILGVGEIIESGDEYIHSCPLPLGMHRNGDKNPSASLNRETLLFNCFTCGGGSVIWLVQNVLNVSRDEAINLLKNEVTGLKVVPIEDFLDKLETAFARVQNSRIDIPVYSDNIIKRWERTCDYLTERGVTEQVQREMRTGVEDRIEFSGDEPVPLSRVILPHFMRGKLIGWVARKTQDVPGVPKYRNSKGFPRGAWLYNRDNAMHYKETYVVESPMSVLVLKSRGIDNVVATFGAKVDANQINLLRDFQVVTVFMDGDAPGRAATKHLVEDLSHFTIVKVVYTPDDEDPATLDYIPEAMSAVAWQLA